MNIVEILQELNVPFQLSGESKNVRSGFVGIECPSCFPGKSGGWKLGIPLNGWGATCWTCGSMPLTKTLVEVSGRSWQEVITLVGGIDRGVREVKRTGKLVLPKGLCDLLPIHRNYLRSRGFDPDEVAGLWGLKSIGRASRLGWRLFIPIHHLGEVVSWTTRSISDGGSRYVSASPEEEAIHHKHLLGGEDHAMHSIVVVEGPVDAMRVGPGAACTFGVSTTPAQLLRLSRFPQRVIVFDSEPAAQARAKKLCRDLAPFPGRTVRVELDAADPGSAKPREIKLLRKEFLE